MAGLTRHTTFRFTLLPSREQEAALRRHVGAARFAYNQALRLVLDGLEARKGDPDLRVPWSRFDLINAFNTWKRSKEAGIDDEGHEGLPWRAEVCQQVFEEAAVDLGRALEAVSAARKGERRGRRPGFPRFKQKSSPRQSFRVRNKSSAAGQSSVRIGDGGPRSLTLPKLGVLKLCEDTRSIRRMLRKARAKILFATVSEHAGRWKVSLNVEAAPFHPGVCHAASEVSAPVGIDRGLETFAVIADAKGTELERIESPRPLKAALPKLRKASRALSRKQRGSRNRFRSRTKLSKLHQRIGNVRRDFVHRQSTQLAKTHGFLVLEDLCTAGLIRTRLARSIADSAWALFAILLGYKTAWYGGVLMLADRFYPSTRRCSACGYIGDKLELSERTFRCSACGHEADRDTNAAVCLAQWPEVAAKHAETLNACGERSAGERVLLVRETPFVEAGRAYARRPRRAVLAETVNTL